MEHVLHMKPGARQGAGGSDKQEPKPFIGGLQMTVVSKDMQGLVGPPQ